MATNLRMEDKNILEHYSDLPVGDVYARARHSYGLSIDQAAQQTLIRSDIIAAIEAGDAEKLPSRVYTIGFLRSYADFLGLDADKMIYLYKIQVIGQDTQGRSQGGAHRRGGGFELPAPLMLLLGAGGLCIFCAFLIVGYTMWSAGEGSENDAAFQVTSIQESPQELTADMQAQGSLSAWKALEIPPLSGEGGSRAGLVLPDEGGKAYGKDWFSDGLALKATQGVWVKLSGSDGELLLNIVLEAGDVVQIAPDEVINLETLHGGALDIYNAGQSLGALKGKENDMREMIVSQQTVKNLLARAPRQNLTEKD